MGLDTFASIKVDDNYEMAPNEPFKGINLCGGMFSGGLGSSSFRGKVYDSYVEAVTGETLYQERIPNETVKVMAKKLEAEAKNAADHMISAEEQLDLAKWFRVAADNGYAVTGWW